MEKEFLLIDDDFIPALTTDEGQELSQIISGFTDYYAEHSDEPTEKWLYDALQKQLPDKQSSEINNIVEEITTTINVFEEQKEALNVAINDGRSKEGWFVDTVKKSTSKMTLNDTAAYLTGLDNTIYTANVKLSETILTKQGVVNQNPNLDGFIAEEYHAQTFNLNAEANGSKFRAEVCKPDGKYGKNSVDIVIKDENGKIVRRYQSKYCKNAKETSKSFEEGDYRGQQKLVPDGQHEEINKKCTNVLEAPDGTKSNPLPKKTAEELRDDAQSGNWKEWDWNQYKTKDLVKGIAKQARSAALQGAAIGAGIDVAEKLFTGKDIKSKDVLKTALKSGADSGAKAALAGALKVASEKGVIRLIPKGTPVGVFANIACIAVENIKIIAKIANGELSMQEGLYKMEEIAVAMIGGFVLMGKGAAIGGTVGLVFGPVGVAIGSFIGGTIGYMMGSKAGEIFVRTSRKIRNYVTNKVVENVNSVKDKIRNFVTSTMFYKDVILN